MPREVSTLAAVCQGFTVKEVLENPQGKEIILSGTEYLADYESVVLTCQGMKAFILVVHTIILSFDEAKETWVFF